MNGNMHSLSDFSGKVVYVDIWATWCGPCKAQFPHLEKLQEELKEYKNIELVAQHSIFSGVNFSGRTPIS